MITVLSVRTDRVNDPSLLHTKVVRDFIKKKKTIGRNVSAVVGCLSVANVVVNIIRPTDICNRKSARVFRRTRREEDRAHAHLSVAERKLTPDFETSVRFAEHRARSIGGIIKIGFRKIFPKRVSFAIRSIDRNDRKPLRTYISP